MPPLGFSLAAEVPARAIRLEKEIKGILIGRAKIKTFACRGLNISGKKNEENTSWWLSPTLVQRYFVISQAIQVPGASLF